MIFAAALLACSTNVLEAVEETDKKFESGELRNELSTDDDFGSPDGGITDSWGRTNVLEEGVGNLIEPKKGPCRHAKDEAACRNCCEITGKAYKYTLSPGVRFRWHLCTCFERSPK